LKEEKGLKRIAFLLLIAIIMLFNPSLAYSQTVVPDEIKSPWIYPANITDPTTSENYTIQIVPGENYLNLTIWNNHPNWDLVDGKFIIAIKSGLSQVTINSINMAKDQEDLRGEFIPGNFSLPDIFPCPWIQYNITGYLADLRNPKGYQGINDTSGMWVNINISITGNPNNVKIYFLAWGYKLTESDPHVYTDSPFSHITETTLTPPIPEFSAPMVEVLLLAISGILILFFNQRKLSSRTKNFQRPFAPNSLTPIDSTLVPGQSPKEHAS